MSDQDDVTPPFIRQKQVSTNTSKYLEHTAIVYVAVILHTLQHAYLLPLMKVRVMLIRPKATIASFLHLK